jgi:hypothetical protein
VSECVLRIKKQLAALREAAKREFVPEFYVALLYTRLGDHELAFSWLDKAYEESSSVSDGESTWTPCSTHCGQTRGFRSS